MITGFIGDHRFLSNFYPGKMCISEEEYASVEHAYQAMKTTSQALKASGSP